MASLLPAFILNIMQFSVQPSLEIMPCQIAFLFSDLGLGSMQTRQNHLHSLFHSLQTLLLIFDDSSTYITY